MDFYVHVPPPVYLLNSSEALNVLDVAEKRYVHAIYQTSWVGSLIDLIQISPESVGLFLVLHHVFEKQTPDSVTEAAHAGGFSDEEINSILSYFASVFDNMGNYKSYGDVKFVPSIGRSRFVEFLSLTNSFKSNEGDVKELLAGIIDAIYSLHRRRLRLGFGPSDGLTTYYSSNCTRQDAELIQTYLKAIELEAENTRVIKDTTTSTYIVRIASAEEKLVKGTENLPLPNGYSVNLQYGDMSYLMSLLAKSCQEVAEYALNDIEKKMWSLYAQSFTTGSVKQHKEASKLWIEDKDPVVESYIGFIESYRDPFGVRAEFESFVSVVNKVVSAKFQKLVSNAEHLLTKLPWPRAYECDTFRRPDFTSLDVVTFASSGIPIGINIPNYYELREAHGFKNVSLGNVQSAHFQDPTINFIADAEKPTYVKNILTSMDIDVALHELLGHGSGKLFQRAADGSFNFDPKTIDILTGKAIQNWYEPGEKWHSKFTHMASSMEECRAECVALYLSDLPEVLSVFGVDSSHSISDHVSDVTYICWLNMILGGVRAMEFYTPSESGDGVGAWSQAHCCARYVILRVLMEADNTMVRLDQVVAQDGAPDLLLTFDRTKLISVAKPAIGNFLKKLQYYKSTGNAKDGVPFFMNYAQLSQVHLALRKIVIDRKRPRPIFLQPHLRKTTADNSIETVSYELNYGGVIQSFIDRFKEISYGPDALIALRKVWEQDKPYFSDLPV